MVLSMKSSPAVSYANTAPEMVAVVLASTTGTRLFPMTSSPGSSGTGGVDGGGGSPIAGSTSSYTPKHVLPLCGIPMIVRLVRCIRSCGFLECVIAISQEDTVTLPVLKKEFSGIDSKGGGSGERGGGDGMEGQGQPIPPPPHAEDDPDDPTRDAVMSSSPKIAGVGGTSPTAVVGVLYYGRMKVTVVRLSEECSGSIDAVRQVEQTSVIHPQSNVCVMPGDLVVTDQHALESLVHAHRMGNTHSISAPAGVACTMLLVDVGESDEHTGAPLKESAKQKKGGLARDEEDIEFVALSYPTRNDNNHHPITSPRVVWKQSKTEVEEDEAMTGSTPKLILPKHRLRDGLVQVRTEWNDVHVYVISPWVRSLIQNRKSLHSIQNDLVPLLVSRQYRGIVPTFGPKAEKEIVDAAVQMATKHRSSVDGSSFSEQQQQQQRLDDTSTNGPSRQQSSQQQQQQRQQQQEQHGGGGSSSKHSRQSSTSASSQQRNQNTDGYTVLAHVATSSSSVCRAKTIAAYLHASKDIIQKTVAESSPSPSPSDATPPQGSDHMMTTPSYLALPHKASLKTKFSTIILSDTSIGDKINCKGSVIGRHCQLGNKVRLNNVILMDHVVIGDNVVLQNSVVGINCKIGDNCSLNDCQVGPGNNIPSNKKYKGESFARNDDTTAITTENHPKNTDDVE